MGRWRGVVGRCVAAVAVGGVGVVVAMGCGGGSSTATDGDGGTGGGGGPMANYCEALADRATRCDAGAVDPQKCQRDKTCYETLVRPDAVGSLESCLVTRACGSSDDGCLAQVGAAHAQEATYQTFQSDCLAKRTACKRSFSSDNCDASQAALFTDAIFTQAKACLDQPCADIATCFEKVYAVGGC